MILKINTTLDLGPKLRVPFSFGKLKGKRTFNLGMRE